MFRIHSNQRHKMDINDLTLGQIKQLQAMIGKSSPMEMASLSTNQYVIVRTQSAGVFAGYITSRDGQEVVMRDARRIWYWKGAASLSQLANEGTKNPTECKFPAPVSRVELLQVIEILDVTKEAEKSIRAVAEWKM